MKSYKTKLRTNIPIKAINLATQSTKKKAKMSLKGTKKNSQIDWFSMKFIIVIVLFDTYIVII